MDLVRLRFVSTNHLMSLLIWAHIGLWHWTAIQRIQQYNTDDWWSRNWSSMQDWSSNDLPKSSPACPRIKIQIHTKLSVQEKPYRTGCFWSAFFRLQRRKITIRLRRRFLGDEISPIQMVSKVRRRIAPFETWKSQLNLLVLYWQKPQIDATSEARRNNL